MVVVVVVVVVAVVVVVVVVVVAVAVIGRGSVVLTAARVRPFIGVVVGVAVGVAACAGGAATAGNTRHFKVELRLGRVRPCGGRWPAP